VPAVDQRSCRQWLAHSGRWDPADGRRKDTAGAGDQPGTAAPGESENRHTDGRAKQA
jgi:hypothetical protein